MNETTELDWEEGEDCSDYAWPSRSQRRLSALESGLGRQKDLLRQDALPWDRYGLGAFSDRYAPPIRQAEVSGTVGQESKAPTETIVVLEPFPEFRYIHTCHACGCHVGAHFPGGLKHDVWVCAYCDHAQTERSR